MTTRLNPKAIARDALNVLRGLQEPFLNIQTMRRTMYANATDQTTSRFSFAALSLALATVERALGLVATWRQRAADRQQLCDLDDHMLRDVGLSRGDVEFEISKPFWRG